MKKRLLWLLLFSVFLVSAYMGYRSFQKIKAQETFSEEIQQLPKEDKFQWISKIPVEDHNPTVVLFFHPDCEHCQYEAKAITEAKEAFRNINLWWVSSADILAIKTFGKTYGLSEFANNHFAHLPGEKIMQTFGSVSVPHIFIYDRNKKLIKQFKGETRIDAIVKYLNLHKE